MKRELITPDLKGRISLGKPAAGVIGYKRTDLEDGKILLEPMAAVPARELWLYTTPGALESVDSGMRQSKAGETVSLGKFAGRAEES